MCTVHVSAIVLLLNYYEVGLLTEQIQTSEQFQKLDLLPTHQIW